MNIHHERELLEELAGELERAGERARLLTIAQIHARIRVDAVSLALQARKWRELAAQIRAALAERPS